MRNTLFTIIALLFVSIIAQAQTKFQNGLIAYYSFKGNANDESGNNHNGNVINASSVKDRKGYTNSAYSLNGENSYIVFNDFNPNLIKTINFWIKPISLKNSMIVFFSMKDPVSGSGYSFYKTSDRYVFDVTDGKKTVETDFSALIEEYQYSMITCSVGQDRILHLYFNGKLRNISREKAPITVNNVPLILGTTSKANDYFYNGNIEELSLYNRPLNNLEIYSLFIGDLKEGLIGYYPLKGNANDYSGNNRNGKEFNTNFVNNQKVKSSNTCGFNGISSYIVFNDFNPNTIRTINFWINPINLQNSKIVFFSIKDTITSSGLALYKYADRFIFEAVGDSKTIKIDLPFILKEDKNSMVTCIIGYDGILHLLLNGKLKESSVEKVTNMTSSVPFYLGANTNRKYFFCGNIEYLSVFDRPLLDIEINSLFEGDEINTNSLFVQKPNKEYVDSSNTAIQSTSNLIDRENIDKHGKVIQVKALPDLIIKNEHFVDVNENNIIDAGENNSIKFKIENIGKGEAINVKAIGTLKNQINGLIFNSLVDLGNIKGDETKEVVFPIKADLNLKTGLAEFKIEVMEERGLDAFPLEMKIETQPFQAPKVLVTDFQFSTEDGGKIKLNYPISLKVIVQNIGKGTANDLRVHFNFVNDNCLMLSETENFEFPLLNKGESKQLEFLFTATRRYILDKIPIRINLKEGSSKSIKDTVLTVMLDQNLVAKNQVEIKGIKTVESEIQIASLSSEVDKNIPEINKQIPNRYALIIGNEDYSKYQRGLNTEMNVEFARNDASVFKDYAIKTLCVPESNILFLQDATIGEMSQKIDLISKLVAKTGEESELIFYYAGHGLPDEITKIPYLIPVDISASNITSAIKLSDIYKKFAESGAKRIVVFLDACFSGGGRESGLLASRGVKVRPKVDILDGNFVVFTASSGEQSALPFKEKQHGIFTYFLLKKLQETKGNITYGELAKFLSQNVSIESLKINQKEQDPSINVSIKAKDFWENWTIK